MREGPDGPQIRGLTGGLLQKVKRAAQDKASSSRSGEADTNLIEHVEHCDSGGIIPELYPQDTALRQVPPQPRRRRVVLGHPHPGFAGSLSPQSDPFPEVPGLHPGLGRYKNQRSLAPRPIQVVAEIGPGLVNTDSGETLTRRHISRSSSQEGREGDGRRTSRLLHCDSTARSRGPAAPRPRPDAHEEHEVGGSS